MSVFVDSELLLNVKEQREYFVRVVYVAVMTDMAGGKRETETDWVISARHPR